MEEKMDNLHVLRDIYTSMRESISIKAYPMKESWKPLKIWESKFGGKSYFPQDFTCPRNSKGDPLHLLAQINLIDMPLLDPFPFGDLLQFYIDSYDLLGMSFDENNPNMALNFCISPYKRLQ